MRKFKYSELVSDDPNWTPLMKALEGYRSPHVATCAKAFRANFERAASFSVSPVELIFQTRRDTVFASNAIFRVAGRGESTLIQLVNEDPTDDMIREFMAQAQEFDALPPEQQRNLRVIMGLKTAEALIDTSEGMQHSIDALFAGIVMQSWTAFECLVSDLWCVGVDYGPKEVFNRVALADLPKVKEPMNVETVAISEFDARTQLGSFLRDAGKVSFLKLDHIHRLYSLSFGKDVARLFDKVADGDIFALCAFRNVLAHAGGRADKKFVKSLQRFPEFSYTVGDPVYLDGMLVKRLRNAALELGGALIAAVDGVLSPED